MEQIKFSIRLFSLYLIVIGLNLQLAQAAKPSASPDFRLVVTGGLKALHGGTQAFYRSPLFSLGDVADPETGAFVIRDADLKTFRTRDSVFFSLESIDANTLVEMGKSPASIRRAGKIQGLMSPQSYGFALAEKAGTGLSDLSDALLSRSLGGLNGSFFWEMRVANGATVFALDLSDPEVGVRWPKSVDEITQERGVLGGYTEAPKRFVFFPRKLASTPRALGIVDHLLQTSGKVPTRFIDLGNALTSDEDESIGSARQMSKLLVARQPAVVGVSRYDLSVLFKAPELAADAPYVMAQKGYSTLKTSRVVDMGAHKVQFSALGEVNEAALGFLPKGVKPLNVADSIKQAGTDATQSKAKLVLGLSDNAYSAAEAIESPVFDAVLALVSGQQGSLPARDEIDMEANHREGLRSVAPLVRISPADVTEVSVWTNAQGNVTRLVLVRHPIIDEGFEAADAKQLLSEKTELETGETAGLPQRQGKAWRQQDFNDTLGGILLGAKKGTELAMIDQVAAATPILSPIPAGLAQRLLERSGRAVWISLRGKYIKRILKASKAGQFDVPFVLVGGSAKGPTINQREISDGEHYNVVVTEPMLYAIDRFMVREGLFAQSFLAATAVQTSLLEANKEPLKVLSELRRRDTQDDARVGDKSELLDASMPLASVVNGALSKGIGNADVEAYIKRSPGTPRSTLTFEITDLDIGFKANQVDSTLSDWQKFGGTPGNKGSFTEPRFWDPTFLNMLINAKVALRYAGPVVDVDFVASEKFFQPFSESKEIKAEHQAIIAKDQTSLTPADYETLGKLYMKLRPVKDATKLDLEIRLPLSRVMDRAPLADWGFGPMAKYTFETQLWPNVFMSSVPSRLWPHRVLDSRLVLGVSAKPTVGDELFHVGALLGYDFSRDTHQQSFAYGGEIAGAGRWNVGVFNIRIESSLRKLFPIAVPEQGRMGMVWLADARIELPIYAGFSVSAVGNLTVGEQMHEAWKFGSSMVYGLALSYGNRFKWLL